MESDFTPQQALAEAERGAVAAWIDYPPTPRWYYPGVGAWATALVLAFALLEGPWLAFTLVVLVAVELAFVAWYRRLRGAWPRILNPPAEYRPAIRMFVTGAAILGAIVALLVAAGWIAVAAPVTFIGVTGGLFWYEKAYERASERTRRRVGGGT